MKKTLIAVSLVCCGAFAYAETGLTEDKILLGQIAQLTGKNEQDIQSYNKGMNAYFDLINRNKINGRVVELITKPYTNNVKSYQQTVNELSKQTFAFVGFNGDTDVVKLSLTTVKAEKIPLINSLLTSKSFVTNNENYVYNLKPPIEQEFAKLFSSFDTSGLKKIALVTQVGNQELAQSIKEAPKFVATQISKEYVLNSDVSNALDIAQDMLTKDISGVVFATSAFATRRLIEETQRVYTPFMGVSDTISNNSALQEQIPRENIKMLGIWTVSSSYSLSDYDNELVKEYKLEMQKRYGKDVKLDGYSLDGYISAKYISELIRRGGRALTREKLIKILNTDDIVTVSKNIELTVQNNKTKRVTIGVIKDKTRIVY